MPPRRRIGAAFAAIIGLVVFSGMFTVGCSRSQGVNAKGSAAEAVDVRIFPVQEQVVTRRVQAVGSLFALEESTISSEVEGRVDKIHADVGDTVTEGQPLVTLSPLEQTYELERQRAAVRQVRARLGIGPNDPLPRDPNQVAFVQRAAAEMFDAEQKHRRAEQLFRDSLISQQALDEAASRFKSARAQYDVALQEVEQLKAQLQSSESQAKLAEKKLADTSIRAPYPGSVKERRVSPGEYVRVQTPVAVLVRTDQLRARIEVPERWAGSVKAGATVEVQMEAFPGETFRATVTRISPSVTQDTRTFLVEAVLPNPGGRLKPGFFINASLPSTVQEKALLIPEEAAFYRYGVYKVFAVNGDKVEEREIRPGNQQGAQMEVLEGLRAGDRIAVAVKGELQNGATIRAAR